MTVIYCKYEGNRIRIMKHGQTQFFISEHDDDYQYWLSQITVDMMEEPKW